MKSKPMERTSLKVNETCLGTSTFSMQCNEAVSFAIIDKTAEDGLDVFDTADDHRMGGMLETIRASETIVAKWLRGRGD
jgi:aryl-alcohol dehydrogenase-like predicted oxidoreductase